MMYNNILFREGILYKVKSLTFGFRYYDVTYDEGKFFFIYYNDFKEHFVSLRDYNLNRILEV